MALRAAVKFLARAPVVLEIGTPQFRSAHCEDMGGASHAVLGLARGSELATRM